MLDLCGLSAGVHRFWPALESLEVANATVSPRSEVWAASSLLSPAMPEAWVVAMQHHPDQRFAAWLTHGLPESFRIGYGGPREPKRGAIFRRHANIQRWSTTT